MVTNWLSICQTTSMPASSNHWRWPKDVKYKSTQFSKYQHLRIPTASKNTNIKQPYTCHNPNRTSFPLQKTNLKIKLNPLPKKTTNTQKSKSTAMEMADDEITIDFPSFSAPPWVTVSPFPHPSPRRLSSQFTPPTRPIQSVKNLAWVSLQGRIVGAEEASSYKAIGGGLKDKEAVAWEMFSPMHRVLIVAVIAVAAAYSRKNKIISQLKRSVEIRDQVLLGMQEKLDNLCKQVNYFTDKPDSVEFSSNGCKHCDFRQVTPEYKEGESPTKVVDHDDNIKFKMGDDVEQEERRMSDLSDWAPSVSSSIDVQWNTPVEQDIVELQKECEKKDETIKELSAFLNSAESHHSKRITELEDIIRRKNMLITKLRKDMMVLEQKVIHLTRLRRPSSSKSSSSSKKLPVMADNLIYDMDSTTGPSDDSDSSAKKKQRAPIFKNINKEETDAAILNRQKPTLLKNSDLRVNSTKQHLRPSSPLRELSLNQQAHSVVGSKPKSKESRSGSAGINKSKKDTTKSRVPKRWA